MTLPIIFNFSATVSWDPVIAPFFIYGLGALLATLAIWTYLKVIRNLSFKRRLFLLALRLTAIAAICLFLFRPSQEHIISRTHSNRIATVLIDTSRSMEEKDAANQTRRLDAVRLVLNESGMLKNDSAIGEIRLYQFDTDARSVAPENLPSITTEGNTTHIHSAITSALENITQSENSVGLFLFTDGRDFERIPAERTARIALSRKTPIYPIIFGKQQTSADVSLQLTSYRPYTFIKQQMRIDAAVKLSGSSARPLRIELLREGVVIDERKISAQAGSENTLSFTVSEEESGQFEYIIRANALPDERELSNNEASTFVNVTDARIPVLLLEGSPHWDSTFLKRTLSSNERIEFTSVMLLAKDKPILWTNAGSNPDSKPKVPETREDFSAYPLIILGKNIDRLLSDEALNNLKIAVAENGITLLLARGRPGEGQTLDDLAPAQWEEGATGPVRILASTSSALVPIDLLEEFPGGSDSLPDLPLVQRLQKPKTLAAIEALVEDPDGNSTAPAFIHRRFEAGQVLAISVGGLWRWSLNQNSEASNNLFDRFWNQLLLNLFARSGSSASDHPQLLISSANLQLGQEATFTLHPGKAKLPAGPKEAAVFLNDKAIGRISFSPDQRGTWRSTYLAKQPGRYRVALPMEKESVRCRFAVINDNREIIEVSPDHNYLQKLADLSGGQMLNPDGLLATLQQLSRAAVAESEAPPIINRTSLWDKSGIFYLFFLILGLEWFLRRRWGLV